jgi:Fungal specific transcription factor domain
VTTFLFNLGEPRASQAAWLLLGVALRMGQAIGLHQQWRLDPEEAEQRRRVWRECLVYERLQSLNFGRPSIMPSVKELRDYPHLSTNNPVPSTSTFHSIKQDMSDLFSYISIALGGPELPAYDVVLDLDRRCRNFETEAPPFLRFDDRTDPFEGLEQYPERLQLVAQKQSVLDGLLGRRVLTLCCSMLSLLVNKALLFLHRPWFAKILREGNSEPLLSPNAASFTVCITSSRSHTRIMKSILQYAPTMAHTWWFFAFHVSSQLSRT